jgi:hypothetical protein
VKHIMVFIPDTENVDGWLEQIKRLICSTAERYLNPPIGCPDAKESGEIYSKWIKRAKELIEASEKCYILPYFISEK